MQIKEQFSTVIRLLVGAGFPLIQLSYERYLNKIKEKYNFETLIKNNVNPPQPISVEFQKGQIESIDIMKFVIDGRKLVLDTNSNTADSEVLMQDLNEFIDAITNSNTSIVYQTYKTEILSELNASYNSIFAPNFLKIIEFIEKEIPDQAEVTLTSSRSRILYQTPKKLINQRINLTEKDFIFEKVEGLYGSEGIFHSIVPVETDKHINLLQLFEELFPK